VKPHAATTVYGKEVEFEQPWRFYIRRKSFSPPYSLVKKVKSITRPNFELVVCEGTG
jgi:hypothetical protein